MQRRHLLAAACALPIAARAQGGWPSRPIRLVIPYPPGGPNDIIARLYAQPMSAMLGQPVVIENRAGAGGIIGVDAVAKAPADGHALVVTSSGPLVILPHVSSNVPYRVPADFTPISILTLVPEALVATPSLGVKDLPGLLARGRDRGLRLNIGTAGAAGISHLAAEMLRLQTGLDITVVPYRGGAPAVTDLLGGQIQLLFADLPVVLPHIRSGAMRALALASVRRSTLLPNLATTAEAGLPDVVADNWYSLLGPAGLPAPVASRLSTVLKAASETPTVRDGLAEQGAAAHWTSPEDFTATIAAESAKWQRVAQAANIRVD
ncbi:tripartite tricarboxylate transporter substrate binding protein [Belnapia sp. T6]|uniref:Tripartite tricarboxylate transporter substrate binding protein n=1 Tax=Belnapia mucosa TaxID=2804532 RepID=A0ABS1V8L8_9PROT|nr:tripartite tricarboxylate transporter substrate binding protein [Belnapia mucosa]MBL6458008.1 tripartite tricarboxylate transporter substrate binding protein [Belnapia mucosa]